MSYASIEAIRKANRARGDVWFSPETMRYFKTRLCGDVIGGRWFVTSDKAPYPGATRRYTVRECLPDGRCQTAKGTEFGAHATAHAARTAAFALWDAIEDSETVH
jgi:hypothetical protein